MWYWQAFFAEHPKYAKNDFFITGESYAGHYIPAFASRVHQGNKNNEGIHINLKVLIFLFLDWLKYYAISLLKALLHYCHGVILTLYDLQGFAIGNGLTDPAIQYKAYPDYALDMGLITKTQFNRINKIVPTCELAVKLCGKSCFNCV
jgi:vitellogenic carboxypeptidase-like protein/serine carboxypeptidase-like clade 4